MKMKNESQVPKIIHLMWFSGDEYPNDIKICLDTWHKVLPEYEIKVWTKEMALECDFPYVREALQCRKWAFAADVIRLYALYKWGGIYMDSDVIVKKPLDDFLDNDVSFFQEYHKDMAKRIPSGVIDSEGNLLGNARPTGIGLQAAFMIAKKENPVIEHILSYYKDKHFLKEDGSMATDLIAPTIFAMQIEKYGYRYKDEEQSLDFGVKIYPSCFVAPGKSELDKRNYAIHCINHSWQSDSLKFRLKQLVKAPLRKLLGMDVKSLAKK